jgi:hypothetical protein
MPNRKLLFAGATLLVAIAFSIVWWFNGRWSTGSLVVSPATTFIDGPLRADGYPDYVAAFNKLASEGVTPANNAAVLLVRAMGPADIAPEARGEFFSRLGIPPLPEAADYFDNWYVYFRALPADAIQPPNGSAQFADAFEWFDWVHEQATQRPWSTAEFPELGKWLDRNRPQLEMIVAASKLPRYYAPLVPIGDPRILANAGLPLTNNARAACEALVIRAMRRAHRNEIEAAWDDLMASRRLGRLVGRGGTLIDALVAFNIDGAGIMSQATLLADAELSPEQCAAMQRDLDEILPLPSLADAFDRGERFQTLELILTMATKGPGAVSGFTGENGVDPLNEIAMRRGDWNVALRMVNEWMDRHSAAARIKDPKQRAGELARIEQDIEALQWEVSSMSTVSAVLSQSRATERNAKRIIALTVPALAAVFQAESRTKTSHDLLRVGVALAHFKADNGQYPDQLQALVPKHLKSLPSDAFAGTPLVYKRRSEGYLLYSLGSNQLDEGGNTYDQDGDDLTIELPRRSPEALPTETNEADPPESLPPPLDD